MRLIEGRAFYKLPWYASYHAMMDRCYRPKAANYPLYGGRGIRVCEQWHDIRIFEKWVSESGFSVGMTLDRIDPDGDYSPDNCRWATRKKQANNRRNTIFLEFEGEKKSISEWASVLNMSASTLRCRYYRGWSVQEMLTSGVIRGGETRYGKIH